MTIDKQQLQKLLWAEVASWKADCVEWSLSAEALGEFLGEKTVEEVALELLAENETLRKDADRYRWLREQNWAISEMAVATYPKESIKLGYDCPFGDRLDSAIDAAMGQGEQS